MNQQYMHAWKVIETCNLYEISNELLPQQFTDLVI